MMDNIFTEVAKLLIPSCRIVVHSKLTQNLVTQNNIILWNENPLKIDIDTYLQFKDAIKKRGYIHYTRNDTLPYENFCLALLCSSGYSLNHTVVESIPQRAFTAAWRGLTIVANTSTGKVCQWIQQYMSSRTSEGYDAIFSSCSTIRRYSSVSSNTLALSDIITDRDILSSISSNDIIKDIIYYDDCDTGIGIFKTTSTPESQLNDLRIVSQVYVQNKF